MISNAIVRDGRTGTTRAVLVTIVLVLAYPAGAQNGSSAGNASLVQTGQKPVQTSQKPDDATWEFRWDEHPSIRFGDWVRVDFRARFQSDVNRPVELIDDDEISGLDIAKRRIGVDGEIGDLFDFQIERELREADVLDPWRDVYINYRQFDALQVQAGKFKLPFSLEENTSATDLDFVYRSRIATQLAPGRDRGLMVHGRLLDRVLEYEVGVFNHDGDNARRRRRGDRVFGDRTAAARVSGRPFRSANSPLSDVHVGAAFASSDVPEGYPDVRGRTAMGAPFFQSELWVKGRRRRVGVEARWRSGPFALQSEYIRLTDERIGQSVEDTDLSEVVAKGAYVSSTWVLTGEDKSDQLNVPDRPFLQGGVGVIELALRLERLSFGSGGATGEGEASPSPRADVIAGNSDRAATVGVTWYLNRWLKIQANVIHEKIADPALGPLPDRQRFWSRVLRFQVTI